MSCSFRASWDTTAKVISAVSCAVLVFVALVTQSVAVLCLSLVVLAIAYAASPLGYAISDGAVFVRRAIGSARIPLDGVREARRVASQDLQGCVRLWASGGLFGYFGTFLTSKLGRSTWYVTNRANAVVVVTDRKTALFSPDDPDGFLAEVRANARSSDAVPIAERVQRRHFNPAWIGVGLGAMVLTIVAFAFSYSPGAPSYTLGRDSLTIRDRFYPVTLNADGVDVSGLRVVDIMSHPEWRPTARTNGFSNSHYHSGWFRVSSGATARMYWSGDAHELVLLPAKNGGTPVLLEVAQPEEFIARVRREWGR